MPTGQPSPRRRSAGVRLPRPFRGAIRRDAGKRWPLPVPCLSTARIRRPAAAFRRGPRGDDPGVRAGRRDRGRPCAPQPRVGVRVLLSGRQLCRMNRQERMQTRAGMANPSGYFEAGADRWAIPRPSFGLRRFRSAREKCELGHEPPNEDRLHGAFAAPAPALEPHSVENSSAASWAICGAYHVSVKGSLGRRDRRVTPGRTASAAPMTARGYGRARSWDSVEPWG